VVYKSKKGIIFLEKGAIKVRSALVFTIIWFVSAVPTAWSQNAMNFYNLGVNSSIAYKKIHYFTKAIELNPYFSAAYEKRGMMYAFQEKYSRMIKDFLKVVELNPSEPQAYMMLGLAYMKEDNLEEAVSNLTHALKFNPQLAGAYSYRAEAFRLQGMVDEAIHDATKAIKIGGSEPNIGRAYSTRSKAYRELGQSERADADFKIASRLDPEYYKYTLFSSTEYLANLASESSELKRIGRMGAALVVALVFVLIFKLVLPPPKKEDD
jgi:tetratricopeptide (TPR) repeat protein